MGEFALSGFGNPDVGARPDRSLPAAPVKDMSVTSCLGSALKDCYAEAVFIGHFNAFARNGI